MDFFSHGYYPIATMKHNASSCEVAIFTWLPFPSTTMKHIAINKVAMNEVARNSTNIYMCLCTFFVFCFSSFLKPRYRFSFGTIGTCN